MAAEFGTSRWSVAPEKEQAWHGEAKTLLCGVQSINGGVETGHVAAQNQTSVGVPSAMALWPEGHGDIKVRVRLSPAETRFSADLLAVTDGRARVALIGALGPQDLKHLDAALAMAMAEGARSRRRRAHRDQPRGPALPGVPQAEGGRRF